MTNDKTEKQTDLTADEKADWAPKPVSEWIKKDIQGVHIKEKVALGKYYQVTSLGYSIRISEKAFNDLAKFGDEEVRRFVAGHTKVGKDAKLSIEAKIRQTFVDCLRNQTVKAADNFEARWVELEKLVWHTPKYALECKKSSFDSKLTKWRSKLNWPSKKQAIKDRKAEEARGEIRVFVQHKARLMAKESEQKGEHDSHCDALITNVHDHLGQHDSAQKSLEIAAEKGEEL